MATTVASRFAVLSLDEDDDYSNRKKKNPNKKLVEPKPNNTTSIKSDTNFKKKKKNLQPQNIKSRNKSTNSGNNAKKKKEASVEQWEEWKQKDAQFVEGNYEDELSQAILLSKLDYEEKKQFYESVKKSEEQKKNTKKNKKNQRPGSNDCNNLGPRNSSENTRLITTERSNHKTKGDAENNSRVKDSRLEDTEKRQEQNRGKNREPLSQEAFILAKYEDTLEKRDKEISQLKEEVEKLKTQLLDVKTRNKKLCQIIASGEMKVKAEVLMEVERLQTVKDELSSEIVNLHAQLMQERSKVRALTANDHKSKDKNKKKNVHNADGNH